MTRDLDELTSTLVHLTRQLVDIESVSKNEKSITDFIRRNLPSEAVISHDSDDVLLVHLDDPAMPSTLLAGHTDTVPIAGAVFPSAIEDGAILGRGTADMKASLAVMLEIARTWVSLPPEQRRAGGTGLSLLFFGREELPPAFNPLPDLLGRGGPWQRFDLAVLMEPTLNAVELGCLGNLNLTLNYRGMACHSARPWTGENAAHKALRALEGLQWSTPKKVDVEGHSFTEVASVTGMRSGVARNVIPPNAEVDVNIRFAWSDTTAAEREAHWRGVFPDAEVEVVGHALAAPPVHDHAVVARMLDAGASEARSKQAWTNAADFAAAGIPVIHFGPGQPELAHTDAEAVSIDALVGAYQVLSRFLPGRRPVDASNHPPEQEHQ